jgi:hypothetical protein
VDDLRKRNNHIHGNEMVVQGPKRRIWLGLVLPQPFATTAFYRDTTSNRKSLARPRGGVGTTQLGSLSSLSKKQALSEIVARYVQMIAG